MTDTPSKDHEQIENSENKEWKAPTLTTISSQQTEGKDFVNADEGFPTSGPS